MQFVLFETKLISFHPIIRSGSGVNLLMKTVLANQKILLHQMLLSSSKTMIRRLFCIFSNPFIAFVRFLSPMKFSISDNFYFNGKTLISFGCCDLVFSSLQKYISPNRSAPTNVYSCFISIKPFYVLPNTLDSIMHIKAQFTRAVFYENFL